MKKINFKPIAILLLLLGTFTFVKAQTTTANVPLVKLNNGIEMPRFGLGTFTATNQTAKEPAL